MMRLPPPRTYEGRADMNAAGRLSAGTLFKITVRYGEGEVGGVEEAWVVVRASSS